MVLLGTEGTGEGNVRKEEDYGRDGHRLTFTCLVVLLGTEGTGEGNVRKEEDYGRDGHRLTFTCLFGGVARYRSS